MIAYTKRRPGFVLSNFSLLLVDVTASGEDECICIPPLELEANHIKFINNCQETETGEGRYENEGLPRI